MQPSAIAMGTIPDDSVTASDGKDNTKELDSKVLNAPESSQPGSLQMSSNTFVVPNHHQQQAPANNNEFSAQLEMMPPHAQTSRPDIYQMEQMMNALPQANYHQGHLPPGYSNNYDPSSPPTMMHPMHHMHQYNNQHNHPGNQGYYVQHPMPQYYSGTNHGPQNVLMQQQNMAYYPNQMPAGSHHPSYYPGNTQPGPQSRGNLGQNRSSPPAWQQNTRQHAPQLPMDRSSSSGSTPKSNSLVRGPPKKPKQSKHAVWIGNLPPQTRLMDLVQHVAQETNGLESLFLISKSNCAFANFKEEQSSMEAQSKLHDSKFQSIRLVCRIRKTADQATDKPSTLDPGIDDAQPVPTKVQDEENLDALETSSPVVGYPLSPKPEPPIEPPQQKDKFFILKSLTLEDLELSVRTGVWATQTHNEQALAKAFKAADNVYLIFSANKSGEYFGYARMTSEINEDPTAAVQFAPLMQSTKPSDEPKPNLIEATEHVPKGRIIEDQARGTTFWEIDVGNEEESDQEEEMRSIKNNDDDDDTQTWGKPFKLQWLSSNRLPFYRTRGLRNPWNSNREVKIARDGTELEPTIGRKLISLFVSRDGSGETGTNTQPIPGTAPGFATMPPFSN